MVFVITEHCLLLKFVLEKRLGGKDILEEERKFILNGYRFADDWIRFVDNEGASLFLRSYSDSSSLSSKCMPTRMFVAIPVPQFQEYSRQGTFFKYWRSHQDYCGFQSSSPGQLGGQLFFYLSSMTMIVFLYMSLQLFAIHKPRLQAPSDYISDVFDSLDPSPQHCSCSFQFKWPALIVPWGSSVMNWQGNYLLTYCGQKQAQEWWKKHKKLSEKAFLEGLAQNISKWRNAVSSSYGGSSIAWLSTYE